MWGERAGREEAYSLKYTATDFIANYVASIFWALAYEALAGGKRRTPARALRDVALISAAAYVTDYQVVPKRLTPESSCACRTTRWHASTQRLRWGSAHAI